jgi:hypothetical protein
MINNCNNRNPLLRDGTSQQQRLLKALLPGYVSVDERGMDDLIAFAREYAKEIQFYGADNLPDGNWHDFLMKSVRDDERTEPHYALFIAFLEMFRFAQDDLNTITRRHLEFYYKDVLRIKEKSAIPDQVFVIFDLAKHASSHFIKKGTALNAGKDKTGKVRFYKVDKDIVVNTAKVKDIKALFLDNTSTSLALRGRLYASPVANSADGKGLALEGPEPRWRTFGKPAVLGAGTERVEAEIGFAMASPVLSLAEGKRIVTITLTVKEDISSLTPSSLAGLDISNSFKIFFSGEKEWIEPETDPSTSITSTAIINSNQIRITRTISETQPAVVPFNNEALKDGFNTKWPVVKVLLNRSANLYIYNTLKNLKVESAEIKVDVQQVKNLVLQNDLAKLDPAKPFQPFTSRPMIGSRFFIGSREIFSKKLDELKVNIEWQDLPAAFSKHYSNYFGFSPKNQSFQAEISLLEGKQWKLLKQDYLFEQGPPPINVKVLPSLVSLIAAPNNVTPSLSPDGVGPIILTCLGVTSDSTLRSEREILITQNLNQSTKNPGLGEVKVYDVNTEKGFMMLELTCMDFGHKHFQPSYTAKVLQLSKLNNADPNDYLPKEPYTPTIKTISLDYRSSVTISFAAATDNEDAYNSRIEQFFHLHPFGYAEMHKFTAKSDTWMLPQFSDEGTLYIGIEKLNPSQTLSLLFKVAEGSADPELDKQDITWSYLAGNKWEAFPKLNILADSTKGLLTTGIITFDIPKAASSANTLLPAGQHWLRASATANSAAICDLVSITAQAVTATFDDQGNDPDHLKESLPAGTVKELEISDSRIGKSKQPFASFGGKLREQGNEFYLRVSERLRHKNRAIAIWDYEHLVLEKFPSVYKVKCLNHAMNGFNSKKQHVYSEIAPGHVTLITISNLRNKNSVDPLKPKTSLIMLKEIKDYITRINPPCATVHVVNPTFEEIQLSFNVRFHQGYDNGFYGKLLEQELKQFLAPWAYDSTDITLGGKLHRSVIINFIEEREYVDFVTCFRMDLITATTKLTDIEDATATTSSSVLTSAEKHFITVLESDDCECPDNIAAKGPAPADEECSCDSENKDDHGSGIGSMTLGTSFIIGIDPAPGIGSLEIENDFDIQ